MDDAFFYEKLKTKIINQNTSLNYSQRLNALLNNVKDFLDETKQNIPHKLMLHILTHPSKYKPIIENKYKNVELTIKNVLTLILSIFKHADLKCKYEKSYKKWKEFHAEYLHKENERYNKNLPTDVQRENYISFEEIEKVFKNIKDPHSTMKSSLQYCLIAMYMKIRPKRSDFGNIRIFKTDPGKADINYLVLSAKKKDCFFVFNHLNKVSVKESIIEPVNLSLKTIFLESLDKYPRKHIFVGQDEKPFKTPNAFGKFVTRTFETYFGKRVGTSMIRHIFINEKINLNELSGQEKDEFAQAMGHDRNQQEKYKLLFK